MKSFIFLIVLFFLQFLVIGAVTPPPETAEYGNGNVYFNSKLFSISSNIPQSYILSNAIKRYYYYICHRLEEDDYLYTDKSTPSNENSNYKSRKLMITVTAYSPDNNAEKQKELAAEQLAKHNFVSSSLNEQRFKVGDDESYELIISQDQDFSITSRTIWGALKGLETFSQLTTLLTANNYLEHPELEGRVDLQIKRTPIKIVDSPRFPWRGFLVDTARHYYPVDFLYHIIDTLSFLKYNTFHWHIIDSQSFPLEIKAYPELAKKGAFAPGLVYTQENIRKLVEYGNMRGVRIVPEIDMPGHTKSWGKAFPDIIVKCDNHRDSHNSNINSLFTGHPLIWPIVEAIWTEIADLFPDEWVHTGADEVNHECQTYDSRVHEETVKLGFPGDYHRLEATFYIKLREIANKLNKKMMFWEEIISLNAPGLDDALPKDKTIVQAWTIWTQNVPYKASLSKGFKTLMSHGWYLDFWWDNWPKHYEHDPIVGKHLSHDQEQNVYGGEACAWSERIDSTNFDTLAWPKGYPPAERLWSRADKQNEAEGRYETLGCHLVRRGINYHPINPGYCVNTFAKLRLNHHMINDLLNQKSVVETSKIETPERTETPLPSTTSNQITSDMSIVGEKKCYTITNIIENNVCPTKSPVNLQVYMMLFTIGVLTVIYSIIRLTKPATKNIV